MIMTMMPMPGRGIPNIRGHSVLTMPPVRMSIEMGARTAARWAPSDGSPLMLRYSPYIVMLSVVMGTASSVSVPILDTEKSDARSGLMNAYAISSEPEKLPAYPSSVVQGSRKPTSVMRMAVALM